MLKQFTAYLVSFVMVNHLAYPPEARAAASNQQQLPAHQLFQVTIGRPLSTQSSEQNLSGFEFTNSKGEATPIVWSNNFQENQGYAIGRNNRELDQSVAQNQVRNEVLARQLQQAYVDREIKSKSDAANAYAEKQSNDLLRRQVGEFQGLLYQALKTISDASEVAATPVKGQQNSSVPMATEKPTRRGFIDPTISMQLQKQIETKGNWLPAWTKETNQLAEMVRRYQENAFTYEADVQQANEYKLYSLPKLQAYGQKNGQVLMSLGKRLKIDKNELFDLLRSSQLPPDLVFIEVYLNIPEKDRDPKLEAQLKDVLSKFSKELVEKKLEAKRIEQERGKSIRLTDNYRSLRRQKNKEERKERAKNKSQTTKVEESNTEAEVKSLPERAAEIGMSPAKLKKHQLALTALLANIRNSVQRYTESTGEKVEGRLLDAIQEVVDRQWDLNKRSEARLFLETLQEALRSGGGFLQMMEFQYQTTKEGKELRGKFNLMRDLHNDLFRFQLEAKTAGTVLKESASLTRFARDTFLFSLAIGAVLAQQLYFDYGANPVAMLQHLDSMKDPIGNVSFYSFIVANGVASHLLNKKATAKQTYASRLKAMRLIPYISMSAGSLASNIMSDAGMMFKSCVWGIYFNKQEKTDPNTLSACDEALRTLTVTGKINQYVPTIMSMLLSNGAAAIIETNIRGGISKVVETGSKFAHSSEKITLPARTWQPNPALGHEINSVRLAIDSITTAGAESLLNRAAGAGKGILKFMGAQLALRFTPGGIVVSGVQLLFMVVQFAAFTYLDHLIMPNINLLWANTKISHYDFPKLTRRLEATTKFAALNGFLKDEIPKDFRKLTKWDTKDIPLADCEVGRARECDKLDELILDWRDFHVKWRADQNARFEQAFVGWGEALKNVTNQFSVSRDYYVALLGRHATDLKNQHSVLTGKTAKEDVKNITFYMNQPTPFYGVTHKYTVVRTAEEKAKEKESSPDFAFADELIAAVEPSTPEEIETASWNDQYTKPMHMQTLQHIAINQSIEEFDKTVDPKEIQNSADRLRYTKIRDALKSKEVKVVVAGLLELRKAVIGNDGSNRPQLSGQNYRMQDPNFANKLYGYYKSLGTPSPIMTPGMAFPYLFAKESGYKKELANFRIPLTGSGYSFEKPTDYLTWQMLCGDSKFKIDQVVGFAAHFIPPSITTVKDKWGQSFCLSSGDLPWTYKYMQKYKLSNGEEVDGLIAYLLRNLDPKILGDVQDEKFNVAQYGDWWDKETLKPMEDFYQQKTQEWTPLYRELVIRLNSGLSENFFATSYIKGGGFILASLLAPAIILVDKLLGVESRWDILSPHDKSFGDAFKSFLRLFNLNGSLRQNLIEDLQQELSLYNTILLGLVAFEDTKTSFQNSAEAAAQEKYLKETNALIGVTEKAKLQSSFPGSFSAGILDNSADIADPTLLDLPPQEKPNLVAIVTNFVQLVDKSMQHLARVKISNNGSISGQPTRSELRELSKEFDQIHMLVKGVLPKYMKNEYQKRLLTNVLIGYTSALNDIQKYKMAAVLTNFDPKEDRKDREEMNNMIKKMTEQYNNAPGKRPAQGVNPRGG